MIEEAYTLSIEEVIKRSDSNASSGLNSRLAAEKLRQYGQNLLTRNKPKSPWHILLEQFLSPIVYILVGAMILAFLFSEAIEGLAILLVIIINAAIGFIMEYQAMRSFSALRKMVQTVSLVRRDGKEKRIKSNLLVPGDIILVQAGDVVPADARILEQKGLLLKESMLTGESAEVQKSLEVLPNKTRLTEQTNMLFNGTIVSRGSALAIVTATGDHTAIGQISRMTQAEEKKRAPLQERLTTLTNWLILITIALAAIIVISGLITSNDPVVMLKTGIALAVAAIPEGLPVVATITLARGMLKLSRQQVVIKKLESVQTLGETNIICTDKTGTLTENKMKVRLVEFEESKLDFRQNPEQAETLKKDNLSQDFFKVAILCNNSNPKKTNTHGDAIEEALMDFVEKVKVNTIEIVEDFPEVLELPFDVEKKIMATVNKNEESFIINVKGAPESVFDRCSHLNTGTEIKSFSNKEEWLQKVEKYASEGLKMLAFANKSIDTLPEKKDLINDLVLLGIVGFLDPPREVIKRTIKIYDDAGISVKMITGDHPGTAINIAKAIGLVKGNDNNKAILGTEYADFNDLNSNQKKDLLEANVFARMLPGQKLELVQLFQKNEGVVGMLGDGVNDAPALKTADIGIAMGVRGTEAAKEVADVILLDDKFTAIRLAIHQGRAIFENIRYFVIFLISCNLAEVISVSIASFSNLPMPLLPMQILYLNLVTDVFPALALGMGKGSKGIMKNKPRPPGEGILTKQHWIATISYGLSVTLSVIGMVIYADHFMAASLIQTNNMAFNTLVLAQLFNIFNLPKRRTSFFKNEVTSNKWVWLALIVSLFITYLGYSNEFLSDILNLEYLSVEQVFLSFLFAMSSLLISQIIKRSGLLKE